MKNNLRASGLLAFVVTFHALAASQSPAAANLGAEAVVTHWRNAVHAKPGLRSRLAVLTSESNQDGIKGSIEQWVSQDAYRSTIQRDYDNVSMVVTQQFAKRRDWNGYVWDVQGKELSRLRTEIFEKSAVVFGPPAQMTEAVVSQNDDKTCYLVRMTPADGMPMTWYINAATWLPVKSVRPGDDSEITTTYADWLSTGEIMTPHSGTVSETDKPDYQWKQVSLRFSKTAAGSFVAPTSGPPDTSLQPNAPSIPFNFENNHIMFKVQVNGREPIWFLLDTGADENVINTPRLSEFGLKTYGKTAATGGGGTAEYDYATGATFARSGVELRNQHVAVLDQTGLEHALGMPMGGLLGYDFISRFVVEIDYQKRLLTLHDPKTWNYTGNGFVVPVTFDDGIPFAEATISVSNMNISGYFVLDFGAAETMTLTSPFVKANDLLNLAQTNASVNRPAGLENQFFSQNNVRGHIDRLALGKLTAESIPLNLSVNVKGAYASSNFSGTIGESIFRRYHVFLDYVRNRVIFEPTPEAQLPFPERKTYGLTIIASGDDLHTFTVTAVRPGSPAERDGFRKADIIASMNEQPAVKFTLGELREQLTHAGEKYQVGIRRGTDALTISAQITLMSMERN